MEKKIFLIQAGFEPAIFWSVVRRVIRCATGPVDWQRESLWKKGSFPHFPNFLLYWFVPCRLIFYTSTICFLKGTSPNSPTQLSQKRLRESTLSSDGRDAFSPPRMEKEKFGEHEIFFSGYISKRFWSIPYYNLNYFCTICPLWKLHDDSVQLEGMT